MIQQTKQELEKIFANNLKSPVFPILAEVYLKNKEYDRALKVCEIGLSSDANNEIGKYILSKIYLINKKYEKAEKILKKIINNNSHHSKAIIDLVKVQIILNRSKKNITKNIDLGLKIGIEHKLFQTTKNQRSTKKTIQNKQRSNQNSKMLSLENIKINKSMATKTMYKIMLTQKKYDVAFSVLNIMKKESKHLSFVKKEIKNIKNLLNQKD